MIKNRGYYLLREVRAHSRALSRMVKLGEAGGARNKGRCYDNMSSWACDPPVLRCTAKTHKPVGSGGIPKSRPIVGASKGLTTGLGEIISDILEPLASSVLDPREAQSTEELLRLIEEANYKLQGENIQQCTIGTMDVEALTRGRQQG